MGPSVLTSCAEATLDYYRLCPAPVCVWPWGLYKLWWRMLAVNWEQTSGTVVLGSEV